MGQIDIQQLRDWAAEYNRDKFIPSDPVQFPHRYSEAKDIEISAFLTAWISYGNRKCIITKAEELDRMFGGSPLHFILNNKYSNYQNNYNSFYRFFKYHDLYEKAIETIIIILPKIRVFRVCIKIDIRTDSCSANTISFYRYKRDSETGGELSLQTNLYVFALDDTAR